MISDQVCDCGLHLQMTVASFQIKAATKFAPGYHEVAGVWGMLLSLVIICTSDIRGEKDDDDVLCPNVFANTEILSQFQAPGNLY